MRQVDVHYSRLHIASDVGGRDELVHSVGLLVLDMPRRLDIE